MKLALLERESIHRVDFDEVGSAEVKEGCEFRDLIFHLCGSGDLTFDVLRCQLRSLKRLHYVLMVENVIPIVLNNHQDLQFNCFQLFHVLHCHFHN